MIPLSVSTLQALKAFIARQKMGRLGQPEEVAAIVVYLASDEVCVCAVLDFMSFVDSVSSPVFICHRYRDSY